MRATGPAMTASREPPRQPIGDAEDADNGNAKWERRETGSEISRRAAPRPGASVIATIVSVIAIWAAVVAVGVGGIGVTVGVARVVVVRARVVGTRERGANER